MRNRRLAVAAPVAGVVALAVAASFGFGWHRPGQAPPSPAVQATTTAVKRESLVQYSAAEAQVSYGAGWPLSTRMQGVVTWLPAVGTVIRRGQALLRVNDTPVVLFYGSLPGYRQLTVGAKGNDVAQFKKNLRSLGYSGFSVDDTFSASTAEAVKRWQKELGLPQSGAVEPDRIFYSAGALRVGSRLVRPGSTAPADVLTVTGTRKVAIATMDSSDADWATVGVPVSLVLPSGKAVSGKVSAVTQPSDSAGPSGDGSSKTVVTVAVADQKSLPASGGGISVRHVDRERRSVLTVPVTALLALAEGGYGIEVVESGRSRIVAVTVGMFADGRVEVSGAGLQPGTQVRMPQ